MSARLLFFLFLCICSRALAEPAPKDSPELDALVVSRQAQKKAANKNIDAMYGGALDKLLKELTAKGDLDGAVAVRAEISKIGASVAASKNPILLRESPYADTLWKRPANFSNPNLRFSFQSDGTWKSWNGDTSPIQKGTWKTTLEPNLIILENWSAKYPQVPFLILQNGTRCMQTIDGYKLEKVVDGKGSDGKPSPAKR